MKRVKAKREWPLRRLGDATKVLSGATPKTSVAEFWNGEMVWLTPKDLGALESIEVSTSERRITPQGFDSCSAQLIPPNSVVMSSRAPIGHLAINTVPVCTNQGCKSFVPKPELDTRYLYWALRGVMPEIQHLGDGCTFDEVSKTDLEAFEIPVPPLAEQRRLVARIEALTSRLEQARQARQAALAEAETALVAALAASFEGDDDWTDTTLGEVCTMKTGKTPPTKQPEYFGGDVPFVCPADVGRSLRITTAERTLTRRAITDGKANLFPRGTVLLVGIGSTVGKVGLAAADVCTNQQITGLTFTNVEPEFAAWFLTSQRAVIENAASDGGVPIINQNGMGQLAFRFPPDRASQRRIVARLDALAAKQTELRRLQTETEALLAAFTPALLAKAFRGEL